MKPIIQCITNNVTMNDCANAVLLSGASPIMAHHKEEVSEVQEAASSLLLNLGATDDYEAMKIALTTAKGKKHPVVVDPVGVAGITFRRNFLKELLTIGGITCIRGNYKEIKAIIVDETTGYGLDYDGVKADDTSKEAIDLDELILDMKEYSKQTGIMLIASGNTDIACYENEVVSISSGDEMMAMVTGSGCMLSAIIASRLARNNCFKETVSVLDKYGKAGAKAAERTRQVTGASGTFHMYFLDELALTEW